MNVAKVPVENTKLFFAFNFKTTSKTPLKETLPGRIVLLLLEGEEDLAAWTKEL
jgi:hypothetical protein